MTALMNTTMARLRDSFSLPGGGRVPGYSRSQTGIGIVHLGIGAFHRAHQALYTEEVLENSGGNWAICGVSLRSPKVRDQLAPQDGLYTLLERDGSGDRMRIIGAVREVLFAPESPETVLERMSTPETRIVSLTVSEKGYCHDPATGKLNTDHPDVQHDLRHPDCPRGALGFLVEALRLRKESGLPGFTVLCCDNLPENGRAVRGLVLEFAEWRDPKLANWIEANATFPCTMVDRIVPATTDADRDSVARSFGIRDEGVVVGEPFRQWVIEDRFVCGRPVWEKVGAELVEDVRPYETMKLRLLNGTHSTLAYLGYLAGYEHVSDVMERLEFVKLLRAMMAEEIAPTLQMPAGVELTAYQTALLVRFSNPALKHRTWQIAMDGSQKLPQRLLGTIRDRFASGLAFPRLALAVAGWMRFVVGRDEQGHPLEVCDPLAEQFRQIAEETGMLRDDVLDTACAEAYVHRLLALRPIFGDDLPAVPEFVTAVMTAFQQLLEAGVSEAVRRSA